MLLFNKLSKVRYQVSLDDGWDTVVGEVYKESGVWVWALIHDYMVLSANDEIDVLQFIGGLK